MNIKKISELIINLAKELDCDAENIFESIQEFADFTKQEENDILELIDSSI